MKTETKYLYSLTLFYFIVSLVGILHHELWLDEAHHWLLARDSSSFLELIQNTRYEGHPILWNILLFGITRFTYNPFWMQMLHILISTSVVYLFLRKAPFPWLFKVLFIFGYFMIFEYNLISRNYILGVLFLFLACSVFEERNRKFVLVTCYLALAANIHLMFCVLALGFVLTLVMEDLQTKQILHRAHLCGYAIFILGMLIAIIQIIPPEDTHFFVRVQHIPLAEKFIKGFISLFKGILTIPDFTSLHFWNSNFLVNFNKTLSAFLGLFAYGIPFLLFKNRKTLFFIYITLAGTQVFFFVTQIGATRYDGMTYILLIIALWMEYSFANENYKSTGFLNPEKRTFFKHHIVYGILTIQMISGVYAYAMDFSYPFTASKETYRYLKENKLDTAEILSVTCDGTTISPYLEKKVWFLCDGSYQSYCHWDFGCAVNISKSHIIDLLTDYMGKNTYAVYVSNYPIVLFPKPDVWQNIDNKFKIRFRKKFGDDIVRNSYYYIFEISQL